jgi:diphosphomevalonate decarboxylase
MTMSSARASAQAQPNIALVKYWGKRHDGLNLPAAGSLSITLKALCTRTEVAFDAALESDAVALNGRNEPKQTGKIVNFLDFFRRRAGVETRARVTSSNNFPTGAGLASSASGFAALTVAIDRALGLELGASELSALARLGSGSAARSIFGGFVEMAAGSRADGEDAIASPLLDAEAWPLEVAVAITTREKKSIGSREGMTHSRETSPFYTRWIEAVNADLAKARTAVQARDFEKLADVSEASCLAMHATMLSSRPGLVYWNAATLECIHCIRALRSQGTGVFFTIDAGPQVKAVCQPDATQRVAEALRQVAGVEEVLVSGLGEGARTLENRTMEESA